VIRFSAFLVAVAVALLVAGVVTSKLALVYVAIGVSGVALLALGVGALIKRNELFGQPAAAEPERARPQPVPQVAPQVAPWEATVPVSSAWSPVPPQPATAAPSAPSRAGYLPAEQPRQPQPQQAQPQQAQPQQAQPRQAPQPFPPQPATAWGSGVPSPADRPADVPRRPAAFTPRPSAAPPSPVPPSPAPGAPSPAPGVWAWRTDAPATQPLREVPRPSAAPEAAAPEAAVPETAEHEPFAESENESDSQSPAEDQHQAEDQPQDEPPAEDQQTQQFRVITSTTAESVAAAPNTAEPDTAAPDEAPSDSSEPEPEPEPESEAPAAPEPLSADVDLQREVTVVPGVPRYHDPQCLLIRFMGEGDLEKMTLGAARDSGCTPCRACLPDQSDGSPELPESASCPRVIGEDLGIGESFVHHRPLNSPRCPNPPRKRTKPTELMSKDRPGQANGTSVPTTEWHAPQAEAQNPRSSSPEPERQAEIALDMLPRRRSSPSSPSSRPRTRPGVDGQYLAGDQPGVLRQRRRHFRDGS
jgi:hypothetical protein